MAENGRFSHSLHIGGGRNGRFLTRIIRPHQFHQLHNVGWVKKMQPQHPVSPLGSGGNGTDAQAGGVAGKDGVGRSVSIQLSKNLPL